MHYYKRNIGDYAKKAGRLTMLQHGAYTLLIDACYDREQFPTLDEAIDWTWASTKDEREAVEFVLTRFFTLEDGRYVQNRIREELQNYHGNSAINQRIALEREAKRREERTKRAQGVHEPPPNQEPLTTNQEPKKKKAAVAAVSCPQGVEQQVWQDWLAIRRAKKLPLTETAWEQMQDEAAKAGLPMETVIRECCLRGWAAFKATWWQRELKKPDFADQRKELLRGLTSGLMGGDGNVKLIGS